MKFVAISPKELALPDYMKSGLVTIAFEDCTYGMTLKTIAFDYVNPQDEGGLT